MSSRYHFPFCPFILHEYLQRSTIKNNSQVYNLSEPNVLCTKLEKKGVMFSLSFDIII